MIPIQGEARNKTALPYMRQLDGLRAFAVLGVLWTHYVPQELWLLGMNLGEFGVRLFFVLSGFLITSLYCERVLFVASIFWALRCTDGEGKLRPRLDRGLRGPPRPIHLS